MSIRKSFILPLLLLTASVHAATSDWESFSKSHQLVMVIKNDHKNEEQLVILKLSEIGDEAVRWLERADFLPKTKNISSVLADRTDTITCGIYEQPCGSGDDAFKILVVGIAEPNAKVFSFAIESYQHCIAAILLPDLPEKTLLTRTKNAVNKVRAYVVGRWNAWTTKKQ